MIELYSSKKEMSVPGAELSAELSDIAIDSLLKDRVNESVLQRVKDPINLRLYNIGDNGESSEQGIAEILASFGLPFLTGFLLFFSIFTASGYLLRGVAEEKENRIMEVLLSSATPTELLTGKIIGLGAVGLLQIIVWLSVIVIGGGYALPVRVDPMILFLALIYFLLGFLFFASMMAGIGAITGSLQESQQVAGIFTFAAAFPLVSWLILTNLTALPASFSLPFSIYISRNYAFQNRGFRSAFLPDHSQPFHPFCFYSRGNYNFEPFIQDLFTHVRKKTRSKRNPEEHPGSREMKEDY